jgi:primosomal protein N' (replication factor Y)
VLGAPIHIGDAFDYRVPKNLLLDEGIDDLYGHLVQVNFGGRKLQGVVIEHDNSPNNEPAFKGNIKPIDKIISKTPLLTRELALQFEKYASHYASRLSEILPFSIPSRHAGAEKAYLKLKQNESKGTPKATNGSEEIVFNRGVLSDAEIFANFAGLEDGKLPKRCGVTEIATFMKAPRSIVALCMNRVKAGESCLVLVPTDFDLNTFRECLDEYISPHYYAICSGALSGEERYSNYLRILNGDVKLVVGTRSAALAPFLPDHIFIYNDQSAHFKEQSSPYFNAREVALLHESANITFVSYVPSFTTTRLELIGYLDKVQPKRELLQKYRARVIFATPQYGNTFTAEVSENVHKALKAGKPALMLYPRNGYTNLLACSNCDELALCTECESALVKGASDAHIHCRTCNSQYINWHCRNCGYNVSKGVRVGVQNIAEQVGKMFPGVTISLSTASTARGRIERIEDIPQICVATPGSIPRSPQGFHTVCILDAHLWGAMSSLDGTLSTLTNWYEAASSLENNAESRLVISGNILDRYRKAMELYTPHSTIVNELQDRKAHHFPPFVRTLALLGTLEAIEIALAEFKEPHFEKLGPFALDETAYAKYFSAWQKKQNESSNTLQCYLIRTAVKNSPQLSASAFRARTQAGLKRLQSDLKLILDPKEFLN